MRRCALPVTGTKGRRLGGRRLKSTRNELLSRIRTLQNGASVSATSIFGFDAREIFRGAGGCYPNISFRCRGGRPVVEELPYADRSNVHATDDQLAICPSSPRAHPTNLITRVAVRGSVFLVSLRGDDHLQLSPLSSPCDT